VLACSRQGDLAMYLYQEIMRRRDKILDTGIQQPLEIRKRVLILLGFERRK
jgi:hypothetical protein